MGAAIPGRRVARAPRIRCGRTSHKRGHSNLLQADVTDLDGNGLTNSSQPSKLEVMFTRIATLAAFAASISFAQAPSSVTVDGGAGKVVTLTAADLSKLPQHTVPTSEHDTPVTFEGVLLSDLLAKVTMPAGENLRGKALAQYLVVEAADGYRTVFALPELDPAFTERRVYLVTKRDGKPLSEKEGPFRIVVPDEKRQRRDGSSR